MKHKFFSIVTKDVKKLSEFYKLILRVKEKILDIDNYVEFLIEDDFTVCVESVTSVKNRSGAAFAPGSAIIEFEVDNVDDEYLRLKAAGIEIFREPFNNPWGTRNFYFNDPDGYLICFYQTILKASK
ncbi:MAG: VOC family protein [Oscillospiraceae bacterium]|nr:VOC family protein [Oscillospiraceae bacterium]